MHFGMFGMWGIYVFAVLILYSPSGKTSESCSGKYLSLGLFKDVFLESSISIISI